MLAVSAVLLAVACGKEKDPEPDQIYPPVADKRGCSVTTYHSFDYNSDYTFTYNPDGEVIKVVRTASGPGLSYTDSVKYGLDGNVARVLRYNNSNLVGYTDYTHNSQNKVTETRKFMTGLQGSEITQFAYDGSNRLIKESYFYSGQPGVVTATVDYTYNSNGSIRTEKNSPATNWREVSEFTFDNKKNPWSEKKYHPFAWGSFEHNPTRILTAMYQSGSLHSNPVTNFAYTYNAMGYPTQVIGNNDQGNKQTWEYSCQ